jgi:hypothetical protein
VIDIDYDKMDEVDLISGAFDVAIDRATEAHVAGLEPQEQIKHAIQGYILAIETLGYTIMLPGMIPVPDSLETARAMQAVSYGYIRDNHPEVEI